MIPKSALQKKGPLKQGGASPIAPDKAQNHEFSWGYLVF